MESFVDVTYDAPDETMKAIDGPAFVNMNRPKSLTTYGNYCKDELLSKLKFTSQNTKRLDLVYDVNNENSLKSQTRENKRGGMRISVCKDTPICKDFQKFVRNDTKWSLRLLSKFQKHWLPSLQQLEVKLCRILHWRVEH